MKSEGFAILSSRVQLPRDGSTQICGNLSELPAQIAAARFGAPDPLPTEIPETGTELPDTGGRAPLGSLLFLIALSGAGRLLRNISRAHGEAQALADGAQMPPVNRCKPCFAAPSRPSWGGVARGRLNQIMAWHMRAILTKVDK